MIRLFLTTVTTILTLLSVSGTVINLTPGSLAKSIEDISGDETGLQLTGSADVRDLLLLSGLPGNIITLDLGDLRIESFSTTRPEYFGRTSFPPAHIPDYCFFATRFEKIILPSSLISIGRGAFSGSSLHEITIPEGVGILPEYLFYDCRDLSSVRLPSGLNAIGKMAFGGCLSLNSVDLGATCITVIPERCFAGCASLSVLTLPGSLEKIDREAFLSTAIGSLDLRNVPLMAPYALSGMPMLKKVALSSSSEAGEGLLMDDKSLQRVDGGLSCLPALFTANCRNLDSGDFLLPALSIGDGALANTGCEKLVLGNGLTGIGSYVFYGMKRLREINAEGPGPSVPEAADDSFNGINCGDIHLVVTEGSRDIWASHPLWGNFDIVTDTQTSVAPLHSGNEEVSVTYYGNILKIVSFSPIRTISVHTPGGLTLHSRVLSGSTGEEAYYTSYISLRSIPESVIIVRVATEKGVFLFRGV